MTVYDRLADRLNQIGSGAYKNRDLIAILEALFTPEEAEVAIAMPLGTNPIDEIANRHGAPKEKLYPMLEHMANKGLLYARVSGGVPKYNLQPLVPGIFELQFMKGERTPEKMHMAKLFDQYFQSSSKEAKPPKTKLTPWARVITVEQEIPSNIEAFDYERVSDFIRADNYLAIAQCYCRHEKDLLGESCGAPKDVCMVFGPFASFCVERGFARKMTESEMMRALDKSEKAGLIHVSDNVKGRVSFMCNCCSCCCGVIGSFAKHNRTDFFAPSNFAATVDVSTCSGCEACVNRCQLNAIAIIDDVAKIDGARCIGCAVCVSVCPTESLGIKRREVILEPKNTLPELHQTLYMERAALRS